MINVPVLIAGGGPVGLTLSLELAHQGIRSIVAERNPTTTRHPKMDLTNGRSMELYRRIGMADRLRKVGVPEQSPFDIVWVDRLASHELCRFPYPSSAQAKQIRQQRNDGTLTLEAPMRVSQIVIEPALKAAADESPLAETWFGWNVEAFSQDPYGVTTQLRHGATGETREVRSQYLVGCDGGNSTVRRQLGIELQGASNAANAFMVHFRSDARELLQRFGVAWHIQTGGGTLIAQNDKDIWTLQAFLLPGVTGEDLDPHTVLRDWIGTDFDYEILQANPWRAHFLVADSYRKDRVFIAGDACHQWMPTGGYGMNCGVADAANLGWKLAAAVQRWGGEALLDSYEQERRPVAQMSLQTSRRHLDVRGQLAQAYASAGDLSGDSPQAAARRAGLGRRILELGNAENEGWGAEHGYRYDSAINAREPGEPPAFDPLSYTPSTWPGSRLPHVFLADGTAVYDRLGAWFTLLVLNGMDVTQFQRAASQAGVPVQVLSIADDTASRIYGSPLLLVRPDQHVAWRGKTLPADSAALLSRVAGQVVEKVPATA
ncbi:FAD-dependent monooxygenase [Cupriavidus alkaliphilus]|uniref:FAD-dependent monooxygenase n=1 Tax=Cupriavidus alkaliphilus TaxID=942866 RepID=UPI000815ED23|nr:FAD-dependent monooxygenase [Cupriavidus alkaliphilus]SCB26795.1 2-polyprenyl-6-methoxyphenol hydroxylase [Cupriavidus alkaliphilus]